MYQQPNANNVQSLELSFPAQRKTILSYLTCNYWIYIIYSSMNIVCLINFISSRAPLNYYTPNSIYALWFFIGATNAKSVFKMLQEPEIRVTILKRSMKEVMRWNWYLIATQCFAAGTLSAILIWASWDTSEFAWNLRLSAMIVTGVLLNLIPFYIQVFRHKTINQALEEIVAGGVGVAADQASFTNQSPGPQVHVGAGYDYGQPQAKPAGINTQKPAKGYENSFQNAGYR